MSAASCGGPSRTIQKKESDGLHVEGEPPPAFVGIRDACMREQAEEGDDVDLVFEIAPALTAAVCGFRPDMAGEGPEPVFQGLRAPGGQDREPPRRTGWLSRLLGRRD